MSEQETGIAKVEALKSEVTPVLAKANALVIVTGDDYAEAGEVCKDVARAIRRVGEVFDPTCEATDKAHKDAVALRARFLNPLKLAKDTISKKQLDWSTEQERIRKIEEQRLQNIENERVRKEKEKQEAAARLQREKEAAAQREADEARRKAAEATNKADRERFQREAEARQKEQAAAAAKAQEREEAAAMVAPAGVVQVESAVPVVKGQSIKTTFKAELVSMEALIASASIKGSAACGFLSFNDAAANAFARATKGIIPVPGLRFIEVSGLSSAAK
jgi:ATPase subunit of ABC transporter with duplicated ATPase domains